MARLIWEARYPAPNPLSILTVATPFAQELTMVSRAAMPPVGVEFGKAQVLERFPPEKGFGLID